jgi:hypothetical protein
MDASEMLNAQGSTLNAQSMGKAKWPMLNQWAKPKWPMANQWADAQRPKVNQSSDADTNIHHSGLRIDHYLALRTEHWVLIEHSALSIAH